MTHSLPSCPVIREVTSPTARQEKPLDYSPAREPSLAASAPWMRTRPRGEGRGGGGPGPKSAMAPRAGCGQARGDAPSTRGFQGPPVTADAPGEDWLRGW